MFCLSPYQNSQESTQRAHPKQPRIKPVTFGSITRYKEPRKTAIDPNDPEQRDMLTKITEGFLEMPQHHQAMLNAFEAVAKRFVRARQYFK
jgi:hypothetical protein